MSRTNYTKRRTSTIDILQQTESKINKYLKDFNNKELSKPEYCEICGKKTTLSWHAIYFRNIITFCGLFKIPIRRLYCCSCKHTFALLPNFIEKFRHYSSDVIKFALEKLKKLTYDKVANILIQLIPVDSIVNFSVITLYLWKKQYQLN